VPRPTHLHCSVNEFQLHEPPLTFGVVYENEKARRWDVACIKCGCMKRYSAAEFASKSVQDFAAIEKGQLMLNENDVWLRITPTLLFLFEPVILRLLVCSSLLASFCVYSIHIFTAISLHFPFRYGSRETFLAGATVSSMSSERAYPGARE